MTMRLLDAVLPEVNISFLCNRLKLLLIDSEFIDALRRVGLCGYLLGREHSKRGLFNQWWGRDSGQLLHKLALSRGIGRALSIYGGENYVHRTNTSVCYIVIVQYQQCGIDDYRFYCRRFAMFY